MKTIWKFDVPVDDRVSVLMPQSAEILCVQMQLGKPCIWARVDPEAPEELRRFAWRGPGHDADGLGKYLGTVQTHSGRLVFHLFEAT